MVERADIDAGSFDAYFRASQRQLLAMAYVLTGSQATAQDLTQEALLRTWSRWPKVSKYDNPQAWTRRVLYNLAVSKRRGDEIRKRTVEPPRPLPPPDAVHLELAAALRSLPREQMKVLVLHDGAAMSVHEIATEMQVPEGTVKSWLSRGRAAAAISLRASSIPPKEKNARR